MTEGPATRSFVLYERAGCHLCDEVRLMLGDVLGEGGYERIDIEADDALILRYGFRVPVVSVDGVDRLEAPMTEGELRSLLAYPRAGLQRQAGLRLTKPKRHR